MEKSGGRSVHFCTPTTASVKGWMTIIIIMLHFNRAIFLTSQVIQRHTYTSIRIKKNVKSITKNKSLGSVIQIKINQNVQAKMESIVSV